MSDAEKHPDDQLDSDLIAIVAALQADLDAKDQRVDELLEIARTLTVQLHEALGNTEYHEDCIRDLAALNPTAEAVSHE